MTREQAIEVLHNALYGGGNAFVMSEFRDAIKLALGTLKQERVPEDVGTGTHHFLPSNLDEAAEDSWAVYEYRESPRGLYSTCYVDGFKAGAEWMAGQGITIEGKATRKHERGWGEFYSWLLFDQQKVVNSLVEQGEEADVIINIRKKQQNLKEKEDENR